MRRTLQEVFQSKPFVCVVTVVGAIALHGCDSTTPYQGGELKKATIQIDGTSGFAPGASFQVCATGHGHWLETGFCFLDGSCDHDEEVSDCEPVTAGADGSFSATLHLVGQQHGDSQTVFDIPTDPRRLDQLVGLRESDGEYMAGATFKWIDLTEDEDDQEFFGTMQVAFGK